VVDADVVESSNLARQVLHTDARVGMNKARSIAHAVATLNPHVRVEPVEQLFHAGNARALVQAHDLVLDCTDNVMVRYLISDAAVLADRPLVSAAAQGLDGQLVVLRRRLPDGGRGPCYRCLFPRAPRPEHTTSCEDGGVLGVVTGLVGTLQAGEAIRLLTGVGEAPAGTTMTFVSVFGSPQFRSVRMRGRQAHCRACGAADVPERIVDLQAEDYPAFCGLGPAPRRDVPQRSAAALGAAQLLVDVRPAHEFALTAVPGAVNVPIDTVRREPERVLAELGRQAGAAPAEVLVMCRRGNDSQEAVQLLHAEQERGPGTPPLTFANVTGGIRAYAELHPTFPMY